MPKLHSNPVIGGGGFHHVAIKVKDFDRAVTFYKALGFREAVSFGEGDGRGTLLDTGDGNYFEIFAGGSDAPRPGWGTQALTDAPLFHVCFRSNDLEKALAAAVAAGAKVTLEPKAITLKAHDGREIPIRVCFVQAPTGEMVEFFDSAAL